MIEEHEYDWYSYKVADSPDKLLCKHCGKYETQTPDYVNCRVLKTHNITISGLPLERSDYYMSTRCSECNKINMYPLWFWHIDQFEKKETEP